jgi:hypothetical protein
MCRYGSTNNERGRTERKTRTACKGEEEINQNKGKEEKGKQRKREQSKAT